MNKHALMAMAMAGMLAGPSHDDDFGPLEIKGLASGKRGDADVAESKRAKRRKRRKRR